MSYKDLIKLRKLYDLKQIYRANSVEERKESSAEHSWSAMLPAHYYMSKYNINLNRLKVYELLLTHDLVEIVMDDNPLSPQNSQKRYPEEELNAVPKLLSDIPKFYAPKISALLKEFVNLDSIEARFAKAIDAFDAVLQEIKYKRDWKGWSKDFLISRKEPLFKQFSMIRKDFIELVDFLDEQGYFE
jgi:putative hydrolase of HD superfamily